MTSVLNNTGGCCTPAGCLRPAEGGGQLIVATTNSRSGTDAQQLVKVICNNSDCPYSGLMHQQCFDVWEASVLHYLRGCGRARSWSERQRHQNLWTKKGYDLAYKACGCLCGRGHLRKDVDWPNQFGGSAAARKSPAGNKQSQHQQAMLLPSKALNGGGSQAANLLAQQIRQRANSLSSTGSTASSSSSSGASSPPVAIQPIGPPVFYSSSRPGGPIKSSESRLSGNSGLFAHRSDFSAFNVLPRTKLNSYHVKMEDEGSYGNDDIRCFILSNLAMARMGNTFCLVCQSAIRIYDRYPLIDGTFFLSPKQYSKACIPVTVEGRQQHLCAVCMPCLEGWSCTLRCRSCRTAWNGSSLILGTMYSYDVFAAVPCCPDRLRCNQCSGLVVQPDHRYQFFSQYSRDLSCPHCASHEHHFVKPLSTIFELLRH